MKLYCVKLLVDNQIADVQHMLGNNNKEIHNRLDEMLELCKIHNLEYNGYSFFEVQEVDNVKIHRWFEMYEIVDGKLKIKPINYTEFQREYESKWMSDSKEELNE